jgi:RimJ/RimL family protein N-acetyltransferase
MWIENKAIEGTYITLEPLTLAHTDELIEAVKDGEHWTLWYANVPSPDKMHQYVLEAMAGSEKGNIAYAVRAKSTQKVVGTTRYYSVDEPNRRAMIGYTWYANAVRRTLVNTEAKLLLLGTVFESYNAIAVEFRTHVENTTSRRAIERLGAKHDGILRNHQILSDGSLRDTAVYSIIDSEWPQVKQELERKLNQ